MRVFFCIPALTTQPVIRSIPKTGAFFLPSTSECALSGWSVAAAGYQALILQKNKHHFCLQRLYK